MKTPNDLKGSKCLTIPHPIVAEKAHTLSNCDVSPPAQGTTKLCMSMRMSCTISGAAPRYESSCMQVCRVTYVYVLATARGPFDETVEVPLARLTPSFANQQTLAHP